MTFDLVENRQIARDVYVMRLLGAHGFTRPGQFAQIRVPSVFLRRPISVADWGDDWFDIAYRVVGEGTAIMSKMKPGMKVDALTGLGNGFKASNKGSSLIIAGGMGVAPMLKLAKSLSNPKAALGFKSKDEAFFTDEIARAGADVSVATEDGSLGIEGFVTGLLAGGFDDVYVCGPAAMMRAVQKIYPNAWFSLEARMACGFGACMGCAVETKSGVRRVCHDGPVFAGGELIW